MISPWNLLENYITELSGEDDELGADDGGSGEGGFTPKWGRQASASDTTFQRQKPKGGASAPPSRYATALQNMPGKFPRTGGGDRSKRGAMAFDNINKLLVDVHDFFEKYSELAIMKKSAGGRAVDTGEERKVKRGADDKYHQLSKEKIFQTMNHLLDPSAPDGARQVAKKAMGTFLYSIGEGMRFEQKQKFKRKVDEFVEKMVVKLKEKFAAKGQKVADGKLRQKAAEYAKQMFSSQQASDEEKAALRDFENDKFLIQSWLATIRQELSKLNDEGAQYEYKPGAFGKPPKVIEIGADEPESEPEDKPSKQAKEPTRRKKGQDFGSGHKPKGGSLPKMKEPKISDDEIDAELRSIGALKERVTKFDRAVYMMLEAASADYTPHWSDNL